MKSLCKHLLAGLLLISTPLFAQTPIEGTWQGRMEIAPDTTMTVQFVIQRGADGTLSAVVNSPDMGGIRNVAANGTRFDDGRLEIDVSTLNGGYSGVMGDGVIEGEWRQEGGAIALNLTPYVKPALTEAGMNTLAGEWVGKLDAGGVVLTIVYRFERTEDGGLRGFLDSPDQGANGIPINTIEFADDELHIAINALQAEYRGTLAEDTFTGNFVQVGLTFPLAMTRGEYTPAARPVELSDSDMERVGGRWQGTLGPFTVQGREVRLTLVFRFETTAGGEHVAFLDSPDQGANGISIDSATLTDNTLTVRANALSAQFTGELSGDTLTGEWSQAGMATPLTLTRE